MAYIYDLSDQWNAIGTTFTGIKLNVTDTASAAGSLLMDLQVGGVSQSRVNKSGQGYLRGLNDFSPDLTFGPTASVGIGQYTNNSFFVRVGGDTPIFVTSPAKFIQVGAGYSFGFTQTGGGATSAPDVLLARDAANTLAQRNGVNAQAFNLYNTYTDASNYERLGLRWSGNDAIIGVQVAGTGTFRQLHHVGATHRFFVGSTGSTFAWNIEQTGNLVAQTGVFVGLTEMTAPPAPAANGVRIYAEDDGAGKTRLMALFATGAAQQIAIEP